MRYPQSAAGEWDRCHRQCGMVEGRDFRMGVF